MRTIINELQSEFRKIHAKFRIVSIIHLKELQTEIDELKQNGLLAKKFFKQYLNDFSFKSPKKLPHARSIIVIGVPQKMIPIKFFYKGKRHETVIPPTYVYSEIQNTCKDILSQIFKTKGYNVDRAILPLKLLAVRSGLAKYGRNNICYIDGIGSFSRLEAFYIDYEFFEDNWHEKQLMKSCDACSLCQNACPTHCIPKERVLIHADHCLTYLNESEEAFPLWVTKQAHNALVGCMRCQLVCPHNKKFLHLSRKSVTFTKEETLSILQKTPRKQLSKKLAEKLMHFDLDEYYTILGRNLTVLLNK